MTKRQSKDDSEPQGFPVRRVSADELVIEDAGVEYRPRKGQWVDFYGGPQTIEMYILAMTTPDLDSSEAAEAYIDRVAAALADRIVAWSFTDIRGNPLPSPPDVATLRRLTFDELTWLRRVSRRPDSPDEAKN